jgi:K+-transporting ATPase KdpF subunit
MGALHVVAGLIALLLLAYLFVALLKPERFS